MFCSILLTVRQRSYDLIVSLLSCNMLLLTGFAQALDVSSGILLQISISFLLKFTDPSTQCGGLPEQSSMAQQVQARIPSFVSDGH